MNEPSAPDPLHRYSRQTRFRPLGEAGQRKLGAGHAVVVGCGALGTHIANTLARAGVGRLTIIDRDFVETTNLQRQVLFDEDDVAALLPKAIAAANRLRRMNSTVQIDPIVADVDAGNIETHCRGADVIVDGSDNFEIRFLINDLSLKQGVPWIYGGCLGAEGQTMTILPGETPCLRCLMNEAPPPGTTPTCDTAGIVSPIIAVIAGIEAMEAIKILSGNRAACNRTLTVVELWDNRVRQMNIAGLREDGGCPTCRGEEFPYLSGARGGQTAVLCGRNAVQLSFPEGMRLELDALRQKLQGVGRVSGNAHLLRLEVDGYTLTLFPDGRTIVGGTDDPAVARSVHARYLGA